MKGTDIRHFKYMLLVVTAYLLLCCSTGSAARLNAQQLSDTPPYDCVIDIWRDTRGLIGVSRVL